MPASTAKLLNELMEKVQLVKSFGDRSFSIYNMDELAQVSAGSGYPIVAVGYEGTNPRPNKNADSRGTNIGAQDVLNVNKRFTIIVGVEYNWQGEVDVDNKKVATDLLDEIRGKLLGFRGVNERPWEFVGEAPIDTVVDGVIYYAQQWETNAIIKGEDA